MYRASSSFICLIFGISLPLIFLNLFTDSFSSAAGVFLLLASVFLIGIPHGAIDHVISSQLFGTGKTLSGHLLFYSSYLMIMLILGLIWIFTPITGMIIFLLISIYHFGQADMEEFLISDHAAPFWYTFRGSMIILLIIFSDTAITYPILTTAMHLDPVSFANLMPHPSLLIAAVLTAYSAGFLFLFLKGRLRAPLFFLTESSVLILLLLLTGPLTGFAAYFAVWHSAGHIHEMRNFLKSKGEKITLTGFYRKAAPFTVISLFGLFLLVLLQNAFSVQDQFLTLMFILISVLTLPHMLIVDRMYAAGRSS
ncbi:MAG: hypothetical protein EA360_05570 [Balneolaceae bacterium]|nr:MAG: hypothetical protein EA360_05570 [Balneolaceae bacterium]